MSHSLVGAVYVEVTCWTKKKEKRKMKKVASLVGILLWCVTGKGWVLGVGVGGWVGVGVCVFVGVVVGVGVGEDLGEIGRAHV